MKLVGLMPVRNEDWVLGLSARAALIWCDELILLFHATSDRSWEIACEIDEEHSPRRLFSGEAPGDHDTWKEMQQRQELLNLARAREATHIALIDADEVLTGNLLGSIRFLIETTPPGHVLTLPWLALPRTIDRVLTEGAFGAHQQVACAFEDNPDFGWAPRGPEEYDFHHRHPFLKGKEPVGFAPYSQPQGGIMHLQFLSERRLRAKQALYQMTEVLRWPGRMTPEQLAKMYGQAVYESDPLGFANSPCPESWWRPYAGLMGEHLDIDREPWQEAEVKRLIAEHGRERFAGLDLFGVGQMKRALSLPPAKQRETPRKPFVGTVHWGETQYNTVVKHVEAASDHLQNVLETFEPYSKRNATARFIMKHMKAAIANLDLEALKMLAPYDPFAVYLLEQGAKRDTRRVRVSGTANVIDVAQERTPEAKK